MTIPNPMSPLGQSDHDPFDPNQVIVYQSGPKTYETILQRGVYRICLVGAGGTGDTWILSSFGWGSAGGSGACVEVIFRNPKRQNIKIYSPGGLGSRARNGEASYMDLGGVRMITANGGKSGTVGYGGAGGTYYVNPSLEIIQNIKKSNGRSGSVGLSGNASAPSVSPYNNWGFGGEGSSVAGGMRFQYLRLRE